jgi:hypothetical protein
MIPSIGSGGYWRRAQVFPEALLLVTVLCHLSRKIAKFREQKAKGRDPNPKE